MRIREDERKQLLARTEAAMRKRELALKMLQEVEDELAEIRIKEKERRVALSAKQSSFTANPAQGRAGRC
jgi:hypothetical protein